MTSFVRVNTIRTFSYFARIQGFAECLLHGTDTDGSEFLISAFTFPATVFMVFQTGSGRYQTAYNDIFLQSSQVITLAGHSRFSQYPGSFLERSCRDK